MDIILGLLHSSSLKNQHHAIMLVALVNQACFLYLQLFPFIQSVECLFHAFGFEAKLAHQCTPHAISGRLNFLESWVGLRPWIFPFYIRLILLFLCINISQKCQKICLNLLQTICWWYALLNLLGCSSTSPWSVISNS